MPRKKAFERNVALEKALNLFWKQGFHATSMQDLVEALGINRASLYSTFGNKEDLFEEAFKYYQNTNQLAIGELLRTQHSVKTGIRMLFEMALQAGREDEPKGCFIVNTTAELLPCDGRWLNLIAENQRIFEKVFEEYLQKAVDREELPPQFDCKASAEFLFLLYSGLQVNIKINPDPQRLRRAIEIGLKQLG